VDDPCLRKVPRRDRVLIGCDNLWLPSPLVPENSMVSPPAYSAGKMRVSNQCQTIFGNSGGRECVPVSRRRFLSVAVPRARRLRPLSFIPPQRHRGGRAAFRVRVSSNHARDCAVGNLWPLTQERFAYGLPIASPSSRATLSCRASACCHTLSHMAHCQNPNSSTERLCVFSRP